MGMKKLVIVFVVLVLVLVVFGLLNDDGEQDQNMAVKDVAQSGLKLKNPDISQRELHVPKNAKNKIEPVPFKKNVITKVNGKEKKTIVSEPEIVEVVEEFFYPSLEIVNWKVSYRPGESVEIKFTAPNTYSKKAWIGMIPFDILHGDVRVNDRHDVTYIYMGGRTSATIKLKIPKNAKGDFDIRMNSDESSKTGEEVASSANIITVVAK